MGRHDDSIVAFQDASRARDNYAEAVFNVGLAYESAGRPEQAEQAYAQVLQWRPDDFNAASNLGNLLRRSGRFKEALSLLKRAREAQPKSAQANGNLALLLTDVGHFSDAAQLARDAIAIEPLNSVWWGALGVVERLQRNIEPAIVALRKAIDLAPEDDGSRAELGLALAEAGAIEESRGMLSACVGKSGFSDRVLWSLALSLPSIYSSEAHIDAERDRFSAGLADLTENLELETPDQMERAYDAAGGVATFLLHYQGRNNTALQNRFGDLIGKVTTVAAPQFTKRCPWRAGSHARLRVGIVSSHLMRHTVSRYFRTMLTGLDPARFDVRVWYSGHIVDSSTEYVASRVSAFDHVNEDARVTAAKIHAAELDVLVYPEIGMDPRHNVLGALRLAPAQCVLYGHPVTSGLSTIDYFLSGELLEPGNAAEHYRETLVLLPGLGACPDPPPKPGPGEWLDTFSGDAPLLLCLQDHLKLVPAFDTLLAQIAASARARIGFFMRNPLVGQRFRARIERAFSQHGLNASQSLVFLPPQSYERYLGAIERATLILDSPSFSGGATSLDALGLGVPVLTLEGDMARGRQTAGMLQMMGVSGLTAKTNDEYVSMAIMLASDPKARIALREDIQRCNGVLFECQKIISAFGEFLERAAEKAATR